MSLGGGTWSADDGTANGRPLDGEQDGEQEGHQAGPSQGLEDAGVGHTLPSHLLGSEPGYAADWLDQNDFQLLQQVSRGRVRPEDGMHCSMG
jgi:hypothetical protein